ncbi:ferrochelatase [Afifella pfennigii]|uniref:ferrochelatase n=1 Tax=Afifella pfennigii TaxID=209897 RepID=UPI000478E3B3|nr:ferrochelatase [Afifella pfennigii]
MKERVLPADHPPVRSGRIGVLLINLGTPDGTDYWPMRRYLKEFLSDRRVIETPRLLWWPILNGVVLSKRPQKSGEAYATIWNKELNESPLRTFTRSQSDKLAADFAAEERLQVDWAMRYGNPTIAEKLTALQEKGCEKVLIVPLYPQYSATTTATVNDKAFDALKLMRWQPAIRTAPPWHDEPAYIDALAQSVEEHYQTLDFTPDVLVASYHGLPRSYFEKGDPYHCHCQKTSRLLAERLGMPQEKLITTFQSRFGPEEWLQPYTDETVARLAEEGVKSVAVMNPGFVSDCLETLEEIAIGVGEIFEEHGGENFTHIPCLNDSAAGMHVLKTVVMRELQGWL